MFLYGGERRRVDPAREFFNDAPITILDEPVPAIYMKNGSKASGTTKCLMEARTTFMIAHRITTLENCDLLLMLEDGRLVDSTSDMSSAVTQMLDFNSLESVIHAGTADS